MEWQELSELSEMKILIEDLLELDYTIIVVTLHLWGIIIKRLFEVRISNVSG